VLQTHFLSGEEGDLLRAVVIENGWGLSGFRSRLKKVGVETKAKSEPQTHVNSVHSDQHQTKVGL
jgi:hypothetical protein